MDIHTHVPLTTYRPIYTYTHVCTYTQYVITHICIHIRIHTYCITNIQTIHNCTCMQHSHDGVSPFVVVGPALTYLR